MTLGASSSTADELVKVSTAAMRLYGSHIDILLAKSSSFAQMDTFSPEDDVYSRWNLPPAWNPSSSLFMRKMDASLGS